MQLTLADPMVLFSGYVYLSEYGEINLKVISYENDLKVISNELKIISYENPKFASHSTKFEKLTKILL